MALQVCHLSDSYLITWDDMSNYFLKLGFGQDPIKEWHNHGISIQAYVDPRHTPIGRDGHFSGVLPSPCEPNDLFPLLHRAGIFGDGYDHDPHAVVFVDVVEEEVIPHLTL